MSKQNPPSAKAYTDAGTKFKGWRKSSKNWREGSPLFDEHPCRSALNEAIRNDTKDIADHIAAKKHRKLYQRVSKPQLMDILAGILRGERLVL